MSLINLRLDPIKLPPLRKAVEERIKVLEAGLRDLSTPGYRQERLEEFYLLRDVLDLIKKEMIR
jgi:hypothetical protein